MNEFPIFELGEEPGWKVLGSQSLYEGPYIQLRETQLQSPAKGEVTWTVAHRKNAVIIAPRLKDGRFVMIRQERFPVQLTLWEFPAGQIDSVETKSNPETIVDTAIRELQEESGYRLSDNPDDLHPLGYFFSSQGFTNEHAYLFLADNVTPASEGSHHDESESIVEVGFFTPDELKAMIANNVIRDGNSLSLYARLVSRDLI
jgi:8-oxo-dGTP pyrophosphatase MutT (NUDIX family)